MANSSGKSSHHLRRSAGVRNARFGGAGLIPLLFLAFAACSDPGDTVLTRAEQVVRLSVSEAHRNYPVRIEGVVTFYDPLWDVLIVQDSTAGLFIELPGGGPHFRRGQRVRVDGRTDGGGLHPVITSRDITDLGASGLPEPPSVSIAELHGGRYHYQWTEVRGVVRSTAVEHDGRLALDLAAGGKVLKARVINFQSVDVSSFVDAEVRVRGVVKSLFDARGRPVRTQLLVQELGDVSVEVPARADPFALPAASVGHVLALDPATDTGHRVRTEGAVVRQYPGGSLLLRGEDGEIRVWARHLPPVKPGDRLDVVGFPDVLDGTVVLVGATCRHASEVPTQPGAPFDPKRVDEGDLQVWTRIADVKALSPDEARLGYPVRVRATVTFYHPEWNIFFVQDGTDGIYVSPHGRKPFGIETGDVVEVVGRSAPGDYAPIVVDPQITRVGSGALPRDVEDRIEYLFSGQQDSRWVEAEGVVRAVRMTDYNVAMLDVVSGTRRFSAFVSQPADAPPPDHLVDARVRLGGVCGTMFNMKRQLIGMRMYVPGLDYVEVVNPGTRDPAAVPVRTVGELFSYTPGQLPGHRVRIQGTVTYQGPDSELYVVDPSGGARVQLTHRASFEPGDQVDVIGFAAPGAYMPMIEDASVRKFGAGSQPAPAFITGDEAASGNYDGHLVQIEAFLIEHSHGPTEHELTLRAGRHHFRATVAWPGGEEFVNALRNGSLLRLTGMCVIDRVDHDETHAVPRSFKVLLRSPEDVVVVTSAPWLTAKRLSEMLALMGAVILLVLAWVILLRRRVGQQTEIIRGKLEMEEALKDAAQAASEAKSKFLSAVSHELRTPLTAILGYADILLEEMSRETDREHVEHVHTIRASGERLLGLVNDLLDLSSAEAGRLQVNVCAVAAMAPVYDVLRELYPLAESKGIALVVDTAAEDLWVRADESRLRQVLMNLTSNAIKFTREGMVGISVSEDTLTHSDGQAEPAVAFTVRDTGAGISPDFIPQLFEQFTQDQRIRHDVVAGTGLGLAISRELVNRMSGTISVTSEVGAGSTFTVLLPRAESAAYAPPVRNVEAAVHE